MRLDWFVAEVMEQLSPFLPDGEEVHFECLVSPFMDNRGNQTVVLRSPYRDVAGKTVKFTVRMADNFRQNIQRKYDEEIALYRSEQALRNGQEDQKKDG